VLAFRGQTGRRPRQMLSATLHKFAIVSGSLSGADSRDY
jgi:hypothetical protein